MKKLFSIFLAVIMMMLPGFTFGVSAAQAPTVSSVEAQGAPGCAVRVEIRIDDTSPICATKLKIKYDQSLELLCVENGNYFSEIQKSPIWAQDVSVENGMYTYIGNHNMSNENVSKRRGTLLYMTFVLPADAAEGNTYKIEVLKDGSEIFTYDTDMPKNIDFAVASSSITAVAKENCAEHNYVEKAVSTRSYITTGYSYKECTVCHHTEIQKETAYDIKLFDYIGVAIRYAGNPSGIAAMYAVDQNVISKIEAAGYEVEIGINAKYADKSVTKIYYGNGKTEDIKDGKIFLTVTEIGVYEEVSFTAYVTVKSKNGKASRTEQTEATLKEKEKISIYDVAGVMDLSKYSESTQNYIKSVINGYPK